VEAFKTQMAALQAEVQAWEQQWENPYGHNEVIN
jgi:hypothetical protein